MTYMTCEERMARIWDVLVTYGDEEFLINVLADTSREAREKAVTVCRESFGLEVTTRDTYAERTYA